MTDQISDAKQRLLDRLGEAEPQSAADLADELGVSKSTVYDHISHLRESGYDISLVRGRGYVLGDAEDVAADRKGTASGSDGPDPDNLTNREKYLAKQLQTSASVADLAEDIGEPESVIQRRIETLEDKGWSVYRDDEAGLVELEGEHTLRSSEHKATRTRKANRWWELRHTELVKQWKRIDPPEVTLSADAGHEDWVTHVTDLHAGDLVRGYDDAVVHETDDLPPIIDHITERSLALSQKHGSAYDTAYLLWGGDFVTNEGIYEGQHENLDAWLDEQVDTLHDPLLRQVKVFSQAFENVVVVGQAGNHGDIRADGSSKQANADLLLYKDLRNTVGALAEEGVCENVAFNIGRAGSPTPFWMRDGAIHGQLRHGQDRKPQAETSARKKEWLSTIIDSLNFGKAVDIIWMGHYHVSGRIPWNGPPIFVTASPLPVGEYPRKLGEVDGLNEPDIATCHGVSDDGVTGVYPIDPRHFSGGGDD